MRRAFRINDLAHRLWRNDDSSGNSGHALFGKGGPEQAPSALASSCPTELQASLNSMGAPPTPKR